MPKVYENVEIIRQAKGITKTSVAKNLKLSLQGYRHIANGSVDLGAERLRIIAEMFMVEPSIFFDDELTKNVITKLESMKKGA